MLCRCHYYFLLTFFPWICKGRELIDLFNYSSYKQKFFMLQDIKKGDSSYFEVFWHFYLHPVKGVLSWSHILQNIMNCTGAHRKMAYHSMLIWYANWILHLEMTENTSNKKVFTTKLSYLSKICNLFLPFCVIAGISIPYCYYGYSSTFHVAICD